MMLNRLSLNTIGLNRIGLNRIGKPSRGSSDRPYIDPEVLASLKAVCICYGKNNDDPDRAVVKNLVDPDNPFIISNAAYKLNSGFGKYSADFESFDWTIGISQKQHNKASISLNGRLCNHAAIEVEEMKVNIIGNVTELIYWYIANPDDTARSEIRLTSGINTLPKSYAKEDGQTYNIGFAYISGDNEITIEQIPSFEGAFVTDGIDDLITSTKTVQDMLGGSNEITVVSMIHQIADRGSTYPNIYNNQIRYSTRLLRSTVTAANVVGKTGIYGYTATGVSITGTPTGKVVNDILGDKNDYPYLASAFTGIDAESHFSVEGYLSDSGNIIETSSVAWYWTVIANKVLTTDQINQVIAYFNLDRCVEPTVWYDVQKQGLTNETPDSDWYLKDYSGNGYDMTLYNYAKTPESGINADGGLQSDGVDDYGKVTGLPVYKDYTAIVCREFISDKTAPILSKAKEPNNGAFVVEIIANPDMGSTALYSFGKDTPNIDIIQSKSISYQTKYIYNSKDIVPGDGVDSDTMWLGKLRDNHTWFANIAIYSLMTFPYSMSEFLIERQLKKRKAGTLYPDMVEFRPVIKSNVEYQVVDFYIDTLPAVVGNYYPINSKLRIAITIKGAVDEVTSLKVNGVDFGTPSINNNRFTFNGTLSDKSPQKIDITIYQPPQYLTMLSNSTLISNETLIKNE